MNPMPRSRVTLVLLILVVLVIVLITKFLAGAWIAIAAARQVRAMPSTSAGSTPNSDVSEPVWSRRPGDSGGKPDKERGSVMILQGVATHRGVGQDYDARRALNGSRSTSSDRRQAHDVPPAGLEPAT